MASAGDAGRTRLITGGDGSAEREGVSTPGRDTLRKHATYRLVMTSAVTCMPDDDLMQHGAYLSTWLATVILSNVCLLRLLTLTRRCMFIMLCMTAACQVQAPPNHQVRFPALVPNRQLPCTVACFMLACMSYIKGDGRCRPALRILCRVPSCVNRLGIVLRGSSLCQAVACTECMTTSAALQMLNIKMCTAALVAHKTSLRC